MTKRIITSVVCLLLFIPILVFSGMNAGYYVFISAIGLLSLIATYEICKCFDVKKELTICIPAYLFSVTTTLLTIFFANTTKYISYVLCAGFAFVFLTFAVAMFSKGCVKYAQAASTVATVLYAVVGFFSIIALRYSEMGSYLYLLVFIGAWATDIGAYFMGKFFGKHKLIPRVSPNKTVEGAIGGVLGCIVGYMIFGVYIEQIHSLKANYLALAILAVCIAVISQIGDLIASYIKREQGIKDYGNLFPGHGGVMDRFDSIIAVSPIISFIITTFGVSLIN